MNDNQAFGDFKMIQANPIVTSSPVAPRDGETTINGNVVNIQKSTPRTGICIRNANRIPINKDELTSFCMSFFTN